MYTGFAVRTRQCLIVSDKLKREKQDGRGAGGCGVRLFPWICQEYTFRYRNACRTPAENRPEYLTTGKEYIEPRKTRDQALSLWSGSTDSKTLDYQRTKTREYQIVRTSMKETTWIQDQASPNHQKHSVQDASSKQQTRQKYKLSHQQTGWSPHLVLPIRGGKKNSAQISPYMKLTQTTGPNLGGQKPKGRKNSALKPGKRKPQTQ